MERENDRKLGQLASYKPEEVAIIKRTVAKGTTDLELGYFLMQCRTQGLNPFNKEIWCYKDNRGNLLIFTGRDGFLVKAQRDPRYNGMRSASVRQNDEFNIEVASGKVEHRFSGSNKDRGACVGAYAIVFMTNPNTGKDMEPTVFWADFSTYEKGSAWKTHPDAMIQKVAEANALKKALGMSGLEVDENFFVKDGVAYPTMPTTVEDPADPALDEKASLIRTLLDQYEGEDKADIQQMCVEKQRAGEFDHPFADRIIEELTPAADVAKDEA